MNQTMYHEPVLLQDCITGLNIDPKGIYVDATFGGGGHSRAIFEKLGKNGKLVSFDQDEDAQANLWSDPRFIFVASNFRNIKNFLRLHGIKGVDGILADLGVSSHQFDEGSRGFSLRFEGPLDMRMNRATGKTAADILNNYEEEELTHILRFYGELKGAYRTARAILNFRDNEPFVNTSDLNRCLEPLAPKVKRHKFMAQVYQALRIEVNDELKALEEFIEGATEVLNPGGRFVVMSYHSLEDRLVKNFFRDGNFKGEPEKDFYGNKLTPLKMITRKPIIAGEEELDANSRSHSAKLRIAEKK